MGEGWGIKVSEMVCVMGFQERPEGGLHNLAGGQCCMCIMCVCRWNVEAAAAALEAEGFVLGDQGTAAAVPQPELPAGTSAAAKAAATAAWQQQNADLLVQVSTQLHNYIGSLACMWCGVGLQERSQ